MSKKLFLIFLVISIGTVTVQAQSSDYQRSYLNGKELFRMEKYNLAVKAFQEATIEAPDNPFAEYASFFYALASYKAGKMYQARGMFLQILQKYPGWEKTGEVHFWLANIYYEESDYEMALEQVQQINDNQLKAQADEMSLNFLSKIESITKLQELLDKFPENKTVAKAIADKINEQPIISRDLDLLDSLMKEYNLKDVYHMAVPANSIKKSSYKVAVLLPFMYNQYQTSQRDKNFVLELYEGIQLALDHLTEKGISIELFAYDTEKSAATTSKILERDEMLGMDLIIGPLFSEPIEKVTKFAFDNKINMVNPVSSNGKIIANNPFSFLLLPSLETQGVQAANFALDYFMDNNKKVLIFHGPALEDSLLAYNYRARLNQVVDRRARVREIDKRDAKSIFRFLIARRTYEGREGEENFRIPADSLSHILVASNTDEGMIAANLISAMEIRRGEIKVIGLYDWVDYSFVVPEQLERLEVNLIAPGFIDHNSENFQEFRKKYLKRFNTIPSKFSALGFETLAFFGQLLEEYGIYFQVKLKDAGFIPGKLMPGFRYNGSNDNQYLPIVRFVDADLINVNKPDNDN
ncbi:MAG: tetratricopeptide repeat protein [Cyclobacteriaceae bacterium]